MNNEDRCGLGSGPLRAASSGGQQSFGVLGSIALASLIAVPALAQAQGPAASWSAGSAPALQVAYQGSSSGAVAEGSGGSSYSGGRKSSGIRHGSRGGYRIRGSRGRGYRGGYGYRYGYRHYYPHWYGLSVGFGYPAAWAWGAYGPAVGYYGPRGYGGYDRGRWYEAGALDLDIKPEEAQIYVDGELVGIADNYDGFPRYLWLKEGKHNVVIYHEGYQTLGKQIDLEAGLVVRLKDRMERGESKSPEEMYAQLAPVESERKERKPARLAPWRDEQATDDDANEYDRTAEPRRRARSDQAWRQRGGGSRAATGADASGGGAQTDLRSGARIALAVQPSDAVIYVNGQLVGSAADVTAEGGLLLVDPGDHVIEVSRPGYKGVRREVSVKVGESAEVAIELEADNG